MPSKEIFIDTDLTNMVRGLDAPAKEELLEKLLSQAKELDQENKEQSKDYFLDAFYRRKDEDRDRNSGRER